MSRDLMEKSGLTTLRDIITEHPEWMDYPIAVHSESGDWLDYIGCAGMVYLREQEKEDGEGEINEDGVPFPIVIFAPN